MGTLIRRKSKRSGADGDAPANPKSASAAPPADSVPAGGDEPPPVVIHELLAAFSADGVAPRSPGEPPAPATEASESAVAPSTVAISPPVPDGDVIVAPIDSAPAVEPETAEPASEPELVAEQTRRSARRSRREAKREAKREKKRLAEHEKAQKKARKQTSKARRKARRKGKVEGGSPFPDAPAESEVRIITADDPSVPPVLRSPPSGPATGPTIPIAGDDLPDAIHVEGDLGGGGSAHVGQAGPPVVFIDEDRSHADVVTMDVATSASRMEPRIRQRRIAVKRAVGRRRLKWAAGAAAVVMVGVAGFAVLGSGLFKISTVRVDGRVYSGGPAFDAVIDELEGANVLRVDTDAAERELENIPWVADARVTTDFPDGATIEVREREPSIAYQGSDGRYRVLDSEGRVLDVIAGQPVAYLELFVPDAADLEPGEMSPRGYRAAATMVQALTPQMRARVVSVSADPEATDLRLMLDAAEGEGGIEVRFGAAEDLFDKLVRLQTALTDPDPEEVPTEMIDVSGPDLITR